MALSNSSLSVVIPGFILDAISQNALYSSLLLVVYLILFLVTFGGIFAPLLFLAWGHIEEMEFSDYFTIEERNVTRTLVDSIHLAGKKVFAWTVNSEDSVQYLMDCGVDGILTDDPVMLRNALNKVNYSGGLSKLIHFFTNLLSEGV